MTRWELMRSEPYRLLFPLAAVLGAFGVGHWFSYWVGWQATYSGQAHGLVQSQAFLAAFVAGFLMTMLPRRLHAPRASTAELGAIAASLAVTTFASLAQAWILAELSALATLAVLAAFAVRRARAATRRMPDAFVLMPLGLAMGAVGAALVLATELGAPAVLLTVGRGLAQEAQYLTLILGAGHLVLPILTGHLPPPDGDGSWRSARARLLHAGVALTIVAGVLVERLGTGGDLDRIRFGAGLRAAAFAADALACIHAFRPPRVAGLHRRIGWLAFWLVPAGEAFAAAVPRMRVGALHVTFIGGFALLSFAVAAHVIASHGGFPAVVSGSPWPVALFGVLFLFAASTRVMADVLPGSYWTHVGGAALAWLLALFAWAAMFVPKALRIPPAPPPHDLPVIPPRQ